MTTVLKIVGIFTTIIFTSATWADDNNQNINLGTIFNSPAPPTNNQNPIEIKYHPQVKKLINAENTKLNGVHKQNTTLQINKNSANNATAEISLPTANLSSSNIDATNISLTTSSSNTNQNTTKNAANHKDKHAVSHISPKSLSNSTLEDTSWYKPLSSYTKNINVDDLGHAPEEPEFPVVPEYNNAPQDHQYNPFNFTLYQPTYVLPMYYTFKPDENVYRGTGIIPGNEGINKAEFVYQLSFKVPLWQHLLGWNNTLYAAYTQDSFWQFYNDSQFFRETDYEPEVFLDNEIHKQLIGDWQLNNLDLGIVHQSNGRGGTLERSWNRAYFNAVFTNNNWMVSIKPWCFIFPDESIALHNPNIGHYMGYGQETIAYDFYDNTFSFAMRNVAESGFSRGAEWLTWSFPLIHRNLKGYVYLFSGYGQSLIEYNHYTNAAGIGVTLNDWI